MNLLENHLLPDKLTEEEKAEYLRLNNKYNGLLDMVHWGSYENRDYSPYDDEEDLFKKQGLSFVTSVDGAWLAIRSKSNNYWWTEIIRFRSDCHKERWDKRLCLIINNWDEVELSTAQYKNVLDQAEKILKTQKTILDTKRQ